MTDAVINSIQVGAHILNASWGVDNRPVTLRRAVRDAYVSNRVFVTSAGNSEGHKYPQRIREGVITVGGTTNTDGKYSESSTGSWMDVAAPAGEKNEDEEDKIYFTTDGNSYGYSYGTSYAAPHVSGIAALLLSVNSNLYNDDVENLIEISAEDKGDPGFDNKFGHGRVNAYEALKLLQSPYTLTHSSTTGGSFYNQSSGFPMRTYDVNGLVDNLHYYVKRVEVRKNISFSYLDEPNIWCRGVETIGWTKEESQNGKKRNYGQGFCEIVPGTLTNTGATLRTYIYKVWNYSTTGGQGSYIGKFPTSETNVEFAYTVHGKPGTPPPSVTISGPTQINQGTTHTWNASVTGGEPPYSYNWYKKTTGSYTLVGYGSSYTGSSMTTFDLKVEVTDDNNNQDDHNIGVLVSDPGGCTLCAPVEHPEDFALRQNHPNPFNPSTTIHYTLPEEARVTIKVFNIMGREVATLVSGSQSPGYHQVEFNAGNLSSGLYMARMEALGANGKTFTQHLKMQLIK